MPGCSIERLIDPYTGEPEGLFVELAGLAVFSAPAVDVHPAVKVVERSHHLRFYADGAYQGSPLLAVVVGESLSGLTFYPVKRVMT